MTGIAWAGSKLTQVLDACLWELLRILLRCGLMTAMAMLALRIATEARTHAQETLAAQGERALYQMLLHNLPVATGWLQQTMSTNALPTDDGAIQPWQPLGPEGSTQPQSPWAPLAMLQSAVCVVAWGLRRRSACRGYGWPPIEKCNRGRVQFPTPSST